MISEETIRNWARLVSESVGSEEKFVVGDVFPEESVSEIEKDPEKFWEFSRKVKDELEYDVQDEIDELDDVEFETSDHPNSPYTTTHRLKVTDCYGGWDGCFAEFPKWFFRTYSPEDRISFGEAVERFGEWLYENAGQRFEEIWKAKGYDPRFLRNLDLDQYGLDESSETQNKSGKYENLIGNYVDIGYLVQYYGELEEYDFYDSDGYGWVDRLDIDLGPGELKDRFGMCAFAKIKDIVQQDKKAIIVLEDDIKFSLEGKDSHGKFKGEIPKILVKNADPDELLEMFDAIPSSSNLFAKLDNGTDQEIKVGVDTDGIENQNYVTLFPFPGVKDAFELDDDDREYIFDADKNDHIINDMVDRYFERKKDERWD